VFAGAVDSPQDENCPPAPRTPYGRAKAAVMARVREWRATTGGRVGVAILYTHESERRAPRFLGRKVSLGVARIVRGLDGSLLLGNLEARRDWGYAPDFVDAVVRMARRAPGEDFVIGTGISRSVAEFCAAAFRVVGLDWRAYVRSDPALVRPVDPVTLVANPGRAAERLGWHATTPFEEMIRRMVEADLARVSAA
jgi:GDPmannose 4,6-dehydratase